VANFSEEVMYVGIRKFGYGWLPLMWSSPPAEIHSPTCYLFWACAVESGCAQDSQRICARVIFVTATGKSYAIVHAGQLWCVGLHLPEYWRTHKLLSLVEGFDMSTCNKLLGASQPHSCMQPGTRVAQEWLLHEM